MINADMSFLNFSGQDTFVGADGKKKPKTKVGKLLKKVSNSKVGKVVKDLHKLPLNYVTSAVGKPMKMDTKFGKAAGKVVNTAADAVLTVYTGGGAGALKAAGKTALKTGAKGLAKKGLKGVAKKGVGGLLKKGKSAAKKGVGGLLKKGKKIADKGKNILQKGKELEDKLNSGLNDLLASNPGADASAVEDMSNIPAADKDGGSNETLVKQVDMTEEEVAARYKAPEVKKQPRYVYPGGVRYD